jgi:Zn-finger nucleic acid-binding protein
MEDQRGGILVDVCPRCKGVWLDRGELEKLIQKENDYLQSDRFANDRDRYRDDRYRDDRYRNDRRYDDDDDDDDDFFGGGRRRGGLFGGLGDLFD